MENASDALVMAGQILIFIIALTVCISSFTTIRAEVNQIVGQKDTIRMAKDGDDYINFLQAKDGNAIRTVKSDTLITAMYRAIKENYVIYLKLNNYDELDTKYVTFCKAETTSAVKDKNGNPIIKQDDQLIRVTIGSSESGNNQYVNAMLSKGKLFEKIKNSSFAEYLGEYQSYSATDVSEENKDTYRIITYVEQDATTP